MQTPVSVALIPSEETCMNKKALSLAPSSQIPLTHPFRSAHKSSTALKHNEVFKVKQQPISHIRLIKLPPGTQDQNILA